MSIRITSRRDYVIIHEPTTPDESGQPFGCSLAIITFDEENRPRVEWTTSLRDASAYPTKEDAVKTGLRAGLTKTLLGLNPPTGTPGVRCFLHLIDDSTTLAVTRLAVLPERGSEIFISVPDPERSGPPVKTRAKVLEVIHCVVLAGFDDGVDDDHDVRIMLQRC
jgi:hypothetical protein